MNTLTKIWIWIKTIIKVKLAGILAWLLWMSTTFISTTEQSSRIRMGIVVGFTGYGLYQAYNLKKNLEQDI